MNWMTFWQCVVKSMVILALLSVVITAVPAQAEPAQPDGTWKFSITPYLWLPNINGTLKYTLPPGSQGSPDIETGPNSYLQNLQAVLMISGDVRKDNWTMFTDIIYLSFADQKSSVKSVNFGGNLVSSSINASTSSTLRGGTYTLAAGYAVQPNKPMTLDLFGGLQFVGLQASTDWTLVTSVTAPGGGQTFPQVGTISEGIRLWNGIVGAKGHVWLGNSHWSIPYYFDFGSGSSSVSYQWLLGISYSFSWGEASLAYRDLYITQKDDKFLEDLHLNGPTLGATFRF